jgi:hypothetical protein
MLGTMKLADEIWSRGLPYARYREGVTRNGDVLDEVWREPACRAEDLEVLRRLPPLRVLAIGEDWCPDVFHTLPTWARLAEELPAWELRVYPRDENPDLMEAFLWKGEAQRIPVYAFYDKAGRLQTWWSGRSAPAERALQEALAGRAYGDLAEDERKELAKLFEEGYRATFRRANFEEMVVQLRAFFHLG